MTVEPLAVAPGVFHACAIPDSGCGRFYSADKPNTHAYATLYTIVGLDVVWISYHGCLLPYSCDDSSSEAQESVWDMEKIVEHAVSKLVLAVR